MPNTFSNNPSQESRRIYLLGTFAIRDQTGTIDLPGTRPKELLSYLALNANRIRQRATIAARLWPDLPTQRARRTLSDLLYRLPENVRHEWLVIHRDTIGLAQPTELWIDVHAFEQLALSDNPDAWKRAVTLYRDDLLPEIQNDWLLERRVSLRETYLTCLERLGRWQREQGHYQDAHDTYTTLIRADALREGPYRGLMRTLAAMGRAGEAAAIYAQLKRTLAQTLDVSPSAHTRHLAQRLRQEVKPHEEKTAVSPTDLPFIGRQTERARLLDRLDKAQTNGGLAVILGEAGIGKSRLLAEVAQAADWRGWHIAWGKAEEFTTPTPYTPLTQALAAALPAPRVQQIARLIRPFWLAVAATTIPPLRQLPNLPPIDTLQHADTQLTPAILRLLDGLTQIGPHLLLLDDVHWADPATWPLLNRLREQIADLPILIVLSGRSDRLRRQPETMSTLQQWDRAGVTVIHLKPFSSEEMNRLIHATRGPHTDNELAATLHQASGGNPLLALTLLHDETAALPKRPSTFADVIRARLSALSETAHLGLQAASILGYHFGYAAWEAMLSPQIPSDQLPVLAGELEQTGLIALEADSYRFTHDTIRATLYRAMPTERRRRWHRQALQTLRQAAPNNTAALLYHAEEADEPQAIIRYALQEGEEALARLQYETAVATFTRALELLPADDATRRFTAVLGRVQALDVLADRLRQEADINQLEQLAQQLDQTDKKAEVAYQRAHFGWQTGQLESALAAARRGLTLVRKTDNDSREADLWHVHGRILREQGDYQQARRSVLKARDLYQKAGSDLGVALTTDILGGLAWAEGDHQEAIRQHAAAADQFHAIDNPFHEAKALNNLGSAYWSAGQYADARATLQKTLTISRDLRDRRGEADSLDNLGGIAWVLADYPQAIQLYSDALAIRRDIDDRWGISISLGNLGSAYRLMGDWQTAVDYYDEALQVNRQMGRRRGEGYNLHGRGLTHLDAGRPAQAQKDLTAALKIRTALGEQDNQLETVAALALVHVAQEDSAAAQALLPDLLRRQQADHRASLRRWTHFAVFRVYELLDQPRQAKIHLQQAHAAMQEIASPLPDADRTRFLQQHPLNREIETAVSRFTRQVQCRLVRADVPLGRKLTPDDYVTVTWTLADLSDDTVTAAPARRRHVLKRLLAEAAAQNAAPTDDDLADVLGVSRRTILRDMKALRREGVALPTRRR